jgi:hypothetical protein
MVTLHIFGEPMSIVQIFVKSISDTQNVFDVDLNDRVSDLKEKIRFKSGIIPNQQTLTYRGKVLQDNMTLSDCGIQRDSVVVMIARVRGGDE